MSALAERDTHTVSVMAGTQVVKTEFLINVAGYYIHQDPSAILFVQPTQGAAANFSKERFAPTIDATPALRALVEPPRSRDSENTITHKAYVGGSLDFVGANSPTDLASRPKRIILCDEIDKYPPSAGAEGDPLKLAEERASTYHAVGRAKFVRTCSPTIKGYSRIGREYEASDRRQCYVPCPHCSHQQTLTWAHVRWDKDGTGEPLVNSARLACEECGVIWEEHERIAALDALEHMPGYGWRQTKPFSCCGETHVPASWDEDGRSVCPSCHENSPYNGHAGFQINKLYSKRHRLPAIVQEFIEARGDQELLRKWTNTAMAELWEPAYDKTFDPNKLITRAEVYGPHDLPNDVRVITGFCDVQGDRLEVQLVGWGLDEECWPFQYTIINQDPAQPSAWKELDAILREEFVRRDGKVMRIAAFGLDLGGHHGAQVFAFTRARRGQRVFACKGRAGAYPIWPGRASRAKTGDFFYSTGVDTAKDAIYARLVIDPPEPGMRKPGFIHFPVGENFGPDYYDQLNSERRQVQKRMGQTYTLWVKVRDRNEALDTFVGALAMRKALPKSISHGLEYSIVSKTEEVSLEETATVSELEGEVIERTRPKPFIKSRAGNGGWLKRRPGGWIR